MSLFERLHNTSERSVVLNILSDISIYEDEDIVKTLCLSIDVLSRHLTNTEMITKIRTILMDRDVVGGLCGFNYALQRVIDTRFRFVIQWLEYFLEEKLSEMFLSTIKSSPDDDIWQKKLEEAILCLIAIPNKVANFTPMAKSASERKFIEDCLETHKKQCFEGFKSAMTVSYEAIGQNEFINLRTLSFFISKGRNIRMSPPGSTLLEKVVDWFCDKDDPKWQRLAQRIFTDDLHGQREFEALVVQCVLAANNPKHLHTLFGMSYKTSQSIRRIMSTKLLIQRILDSSRIASILGYIDFCESYKGIVEVLENTSQIWANPSFIGNSNLHQNHHLTRIILHSLFLLKNQPIDVMKLHATISVGVHERLSNSDFQIRQSGMFVGECLSTRLSSIDEKMQLKFDYDEDEWFKEMKSIFNNGITSQPIKIEEVDVPSPPKPVQTEPDVILDSDDDEDFPNYEIPEEEKNFEKLAEHEEPLKKCEPPSYIIDAFDQLAEKEKYEVFEAALKSLDAMIRRNALGFSNIATRLACRLWYLDDKFSTPGFEALRTSCLISCIVMKPEIVPELIRRMFSSEPSMSHRFHLLESIRNAAKEMGVPVKVSDDQSSFRQIENTMECWGKVTKTFNRKRINYNNRLPKYVNYMFYPLFVQKSPEHIELKGRDSAFFARIIFTLAEILSSCGMSSNSPRMAISLIEYVKPLRNFSDSYVRISSIFSYCTVVELFTKEVLEELFGESLTEWAQWASSLSSDVDAHETERKLATCLLTEIWKKIQ